MTTKAGSFASSLYPAQPASAHLSVQASRPSVVASSGNPSLAIQRQAVGKKPPQFLSTYRGWPIWLLDVRVNRQTVFSRKCAVLQWQHPDDQNHPTIRYTYQIRPGESLNQAIEIVRILIDQTIALAKQHEARNFNALTALDL